MAAARPVRRPLVAGNWKMNLNHLEAIALVQKLAFSLSEDQLSAAEVAVLPPFVDLRSVQSLVDGDRLLLAYGAQDVSAHESGAYTGEVSAAMLAKLGCRYVLAGHSERRQHHGEDDACVNAKVRAILGRSMVPVLCVGEGLEVRRAGDQVAHCVDQLRGGLAEVSEAQAASLVVAYEPVWAIGTGEVATPADAQEVGSALRRRLGELYSGAVAEQARVLYGGSVKAANAADILAQADIDGVLVGGASLDAGEFTGICAAAAAA